MPYLGNRPDNIVIRNAQEEFNYTATSSQTTFTGADTNNNILAYNPGNVEIFFNGARLEEADFTATNGTSVVLASAASANDLISIVATDVFEATDTVSKTNGGTFSNNIGVSGILTADNINTTGYIRGPSSFTIDPASHGDNTGTVVIAGDLTVNGTTTTVNSNTVNIGDNLLVLNSDETGTPSQNAGIEVERGSATNVAFRWNETSDKWQFTNDGSSYIDLGESDLVGDTTPQLGGNLDTNGKNIAFGDSASAGTDDTLTFGAGPDGQIYSDGNNFIIEGATTGIYQTKVRGTTGLSLEMNGGSGGYASGINMFGTNSSDIAVRLQYGSGTKLQTTNTGVTVTGTLFADALDIDNIGINGGTITGQTGSMSLSGNVTVENGNFIVDTNTLYVDSSNNRVGIGTTTIGDKLVVQGAASATASIIVQDPTANDYGAHFSFDDANNRVIIGGLTNGAKNVVLNIPRDTKHLGVGTNPLDGVLQIAGTGSHTRFVMEAAGTSSSTDKLYMSYHTNGGTEIAQIAVEEGATNQGQIKFSTGGTNFAMIIDKDGNVGVGITSPGTSIHMKDAITNPNTISTNMTIPASSNSMMAGPITLNATVTIPSGSTWTIV